MYISCATIKITLTFLTYNLSCNSNRFGLQLSKPSTYLDTALGKTLNISQFIIEVERGNRYF